jgi:hypothetical protein
VDRDPDRCVRILRRGRGFAAWGPGFYVWEEDAAELLGVAGALATAVRGAVLPPPDTRRLLPTRPTPRR